MSKLRRNMLLLILVLASTAALFLWWGPLKNLMSFYSDSIPLRKIVSDVGLGDSEQSAGGTEAEGGGRSSARRASLRRVEIRPQMDSVPEPAEDLTKASQLPPSPPLPVLPPESTQEERKEAFELTQSVDQIVLKDEPLKVEGKEVTIGEILNQLQGKKDFQQLFPSIQELEIGGYIRKPIFPPKPQVAPTAFYGVRSVRSGENLWKIHYRIIQEYMARRHMMLPPKADEPFPDGRSTGIARVLKFIEDVVFVYSLDYDRLEKDLNSIHPDSVLVFFKISDLFAVLDQLKPEDLKWVRYVNNRLRIERPEQSRDLLDSHMLLEDKTGKSVQAQ